MHLLHRSTTNCFLRERKKVRNREVPRFPRFCNPAVFPPGFDQEPSCCSVLWHFLPGWGSSSSGTYTADGASPGQCFCSTALPPQLATAARKWVKGSCGSFLHVCAALLHKSNPQSCPVHNILGSSFSDKQALQQQQRKRERKMFRCRREIESPNSAGTAGKRTEVAAFGVVAFLQLL